MEVVGNRDPTMVEFYAHLSATQASYCSNTGAQFFQDVPSVSLRFPARPGQQKTAEQYTLRVRCEERRLLVQAAHFSVSLQPTPTTDALAFDLFRPDINTFNSTQENGHEACSNLISLSVLGGLQRRYSTQRTSSREA